MTTVDGNALRRRIQDAARGGRWWDSGELPRRARRWLEQNPTASAVGRPQWQALVAAGRKSQEFEGFCRDIEDHLTKAAARDRSEVNWRRPGLATALAKEVREAAKGGPGEQTQRFRQLLAHLPQDEEQTATTGKLEDERRMARGREFLKCLLMAVVGGVAIHGGTKR